VQKRAKSECGRVPKFEGPSKVISSPIFRVHSKTCRIEESAEEWHMNLKVDLQGVLTVLLLLASVSSQAPAPSSQDRHLCTLGDVLGEQDG